MRIIDKDTVEILAYAHGNISRESDGFDNYEFYGIENITDFAQAIIAEYVGSGGEAVGFVDINDETGIAIDLILENCDGLYQGQKLFTHPPQHDLQAKLDIAIKAMETYSIDDIAKALLTIKG
jgi:hypothetical protein